MFDILIQILACAGTALLIALASGSIACTVLMVLLFAKWIKDDQ